MKRRALLLAVPVVILAGAAGIAWWRRHAIGPVRRGLETAVARGCVSCHGPGGARADRTGAQAIGLVPSFSREDVTEYARSVGETREWIRDGAPRRLRENPVARFFLERQAIRMPAFGGRISEDETRQIVQYIGWLREEGDTPSSDARRSAAEE